MDQFIKNINSYDVLTSTPNSSPQKLSSSREVGGSSVHTLTSDEKFFVLMAANYGSPEAFEKFLNVYKTIVTEKLVSKVNSAIKSPHKYWNEVSAYGTMSEEELKDLFEGNKGASHSIHVKTIQRSLWNAGQPAVCIGTNPTDVSSLDALPEVRSMFKDVSNIIKGFESEKLDVIKNVLINIVACAQNDVRDGVKTRQDRILAVKNIVSHFVTGRLPYALSSDDFKVPKEPGVALPHTLSPRDWLGTMVTALVEKEFGSEVLVVFRDGDINQVRQYRDNKFDYLLVSPDEFSAYSISNTPALYAHNRVTDDGQWEWRQTEQRVKKRVAYQLSTLGLSGQQQSVREELRMEYELEEALALKGESGTIEFIQDYFGIVPEDIGQWMNKKYCLRFYSRGFSKPTEVKANPQYIHVCKSSILSSLVPGEYYPITLSDLHSVVLFPMRLWNSSAYALRAAKTNSVAAYRSAFGMRSIANSMNTVQLFMTLYQLAHVFEMYRCWSAGKAYDAKAYSDKIDEPLRTSKDKFFSQLFHARKVDLVSRGKIMDIFCPVALSPVIGMWLAPSTSALGKEGLNDVQSDNAFIRDLDAYETQDYEDFESNSIYDFGSSFRALTPNHEEDVSNEEEFGFDFFSDVEGQGSSSSISVADCDDTDFDPNSIYESNPLSKN